MPEKTGAGNRRAYHHGDLRHAVLTAALDVIASEGPDAVSLRDLARRAGVSHAAPAHHFGDRTGLLTSIATDGFEMLAGALAEADGLRDAGVRYVRFATAHPAHFQVMFSPQLLRAQDLELVTAKALATQRLQVALSEIPEAGRGSDEGLARMAAWSLAHGFATLLLGHNLDDALAGRAPEDAFAELAGMLFHS
ncbi:TetR/AcrR family transcriptional regulator [Streptomyces sp. NPDC058045]|uniref:TetR/AcrR family transcriptional regulator n=1 Tax=Streptomyces sp. NPDC058045 TaxID=3346311 RepID=UPI0036EF8680